MIKCVVCGEPWEDDDRALLALKRLITQRFDKSSYADALQIYWQHFDPLGLLNQGSGPRRHGAAAMSPANV